MKRTHHLSFFGFTLPFFFVYLLFILCTAAVAKAKPTSSDNAVVDENTASSDNSSSSSSVFSTTFNGIGSLPSQRLTINSCQAQNIIATASSLAVSLDISDNIAVVDAAGLLVGFLRMDNAFLGGVDLSIKKARAVVLFNGLSSAELYQGSLPGGGLYGLTDTNGGLALFPGGLALYKNGFLLGGIGVSGGTTDQDALVAKEGLSWLTNSTMGEC